MPAMNDRPASWKMSTPKQMEKLAAQKAPAPAASEPAPDAPPPVEWWDSVLSDPRAAGKAWIPIQQRAAVGNASGVAARRVSEMFPDGRDKASRCDQALRSARGVEGRWSGVARRRLPASNRST